MNAQHIFLSLFILLLSCANSPEVDDPKYLTLRNPDPDIPLSELITRYGMENKTISILVDKSDFNLKILADTIIIKTYPVVLGGNPGDDKLCEGDKRTPEGEFKIKDLYPHIKWSRFLWLDYPTAESYNKHNAAKQNGEIESEATIGGEIGIHGVPDNDAKLIDDQVNWTLGCISLKNEHIEEIYEVVTKGTIVVIRK